MADEIAVVEVAPVLKPGYKTTEFWFSCAAQMVSLAFASGLVSSGTIYDKVLGLLAMALASLGYSVSRGLAKKA